MKALVSLRNKQMNCVEGQASLFLPSKLAGPLLSTYDWVIYLYPQFETKVLEVDFKN